ncbi:MAG: 50S ribosomal protein L9 [Myxococcota bacterium]
MKVILNEEIESLGQPGDVVKVAAGYARNFLLPRGLAVLATPRNVRQLEHTRKVVADRQAKVVKALEKEQNAISAISLTITAQAGEEGKLFGSVTTADLAAALHHEGVAVDRKRILLDEPIRQIGEHEVEVKLHAQVTAKFKVNVVAALAGSD